MTLGRVNASARKTTSGCRRRTSAMSHSQNANGFVCGLSTRKIVTAARDPEEHDAEELVTERLPAALEVERVDVLVPLRRVLRVAGSVPSGRRRNHLRVRLRPGMVGRRLEREVERDLDAEHARPSDEVVEVGERPELGMDRGVASLRAADRPRLPGSPGPAASVLFGPFRCERPIGWMGGR
jgi:hypothetical protein